VDAYPIELINAILHHMMTAYSRDGISVFIVDVFLVYGIGTIIGT
jgi:hypothetical protein